MFVWEATGFILGYSIEEDVLSLAFRGYEPTLEMSRGGCVRVLEINEFKAGNRGIRLTIYLHIALKGLHASIRQNCVSAIHYVLTRWLNAT